MINNSISQELTIDVEISRDSVSCFTNDWASLISDNQQHILELNSLNEGKKDEIKKELAQVFMNCLPNCEPITLVNCLLGLSVDEFINYYKLNSKYINDKTSKHLISQYLDKYESLADDFIQSKQLKGSLGLYYFEVNNYSIDHIEACPYSFSNRNDIILLPKIKLYSDSSIGGVEDDVVGLSEHLVDVKVEYNGFIAKHLISDASKVYEGFADGFAKESHKPALVGVQVILAG